VLVRFTHLGTDYNAGFVKGGANGNYRVAEVKARFNRSAPAKVVDACGRLATAFTAATTKTK
jgi:hypothetical protein